MSHKVPVEFLIYTKRGSSYNKRRIVLLKDELQYYELEGELNYLFYIYKYKSQSI